MIIIDTPKILFGTFLIIVFLLVFVLTFLPISGSKDSVEFIIDRGNKTTEISQSLKDAGLIRSRYIFLAYTLISGNDRNLKAGKYNLSPSMNIPEITKMFSEGLSVSEDITVVIPEGLNIWEIGEKLAEANLIEKMSGPEGEFVKSAKSYEGYLFPDTYRFKKTATIDEIINKMRNNFEDKKTKLGTLSHEQVIMASILEKEVRSQIDMKIAAGILWKRLGAKIPLQADATVAYGVCREKNLNSCDITQVSLIDGIPKDNPYNTYKRLGLPLGPISNPGLATLRAATKPITTDYWFYLSATAEDGRTIFSKTIAEHEKNRAKYIKH